MANFEAEQAFLRSMQDAEDTSTTSTPSKNPHPSQTDQHQPQTIGGFIVDDDDEDDEDEADGFNNEHNGQNDNISSVPLNSQKVENTEHSDSNRVLNIERDSSSTPLPQSTLTKSPNHASSAAATRTSSSTPSPSHQKDSTQAQSRYNGSDHFHTGHADTVPNAYHVPSSANDAAHSEQASAAAQTIPNDPVPAQVQNDASTDMSSVNSLPKARLPHDRVGILEDRIGEDPKGDVDAWLSLIAEHKKRNKKEEVRNVYERFFKVFPTAVSSPQSSLENQFANPQGVKVLICGAPLAMKKAEKWVEYANWELENNEFNRVAQIFTDSLMKVPNLPLWNTYLNYVRRRNNITTDPTGNARQVISQTYDFVLQHIGHDKDAGQLWIDYVQFLRSGPGQVGGSSWQDQQKMDMLRKTYQRAVCIPTSAVNALWKEYDSFEMDLNKNNKATARQFLQQKSPAYMTARAANTALQGLIRELNRTTIPSLPPAPGFEGEVEYMKQVELWKKWINWEKDDPLAIQDEDPKQYKARIVYVYKQALMALRFWPQMWFEAAQFCLSNDLESEGTELLKDGIAANPESCLLTFRLAERIEASTKREEGEEKLKRRGETIREPFDKLLDTLYDMIKQAEKREAGAIARIKENAAQERNGLAMDTQDDDEDDERVQKLADLEAAQQAQIDILKLTSGAQIKILSRTTSCTWIALMQAMRRVQGKGRVGGVVGGTRQIVTDARKRGRLTFDFYIAAALMEYHCYKEPAATKLWDRGMKLFPTNEEFALAYMKHLVAINDFTNARAVFETAVSKMAQTPENIAKSKVLYLYFHQFESQFGELIQIHKLEKRMSDLFPDDPQLDLFSRRNLAGSFDPTAVRLIVSPKSQTRPKYVLPSVEKSPSNQSHSRQGSVQPSIQVNSPKRALEESDSEMHPPRKVARGESPLKGAAGRRLDAAKRSNLRNETTQNGMPQQQPIPHIPPPPIPTIAIQPPQPLPRELHYLLSIIPPAHAYNAIRLDPNAMVNLLRKVDPSKAVMNHVLTPTPQQSSTATPTYGFQPPPPQAGIHSQAYGYGR